MRRASDPILRRENNRNNVLISLANGRRKGTERGGGDKRSIEHVLRQTAVGWERALRAVVANNHRIQVVLVCV